VSLAIGGKLGSLVAGMKPGATRAGTRALLTLGTAYYGAAAQQVGANIAAGRPALEGVDMAALGGAIQGAPAAGLSLFHGAPPREALPTRPEPISEPPPPEVPPPEAQPEIGPKGGPVKGAEERTLEQAQQPVQEPAVQTEPSVNLSPEGQAQQARMDAQPEVRQLEAQATENDQALHQQADDLQRRYEMELALAQPQQPMTRPVPWVERNIDPSVPVHPMEQEVTPYTERALAPVRPLLDSVNVPTEISNTTEHPFQVVTDSSGKIKLQYNPTLMAAQAEAIRSQGGNWQRYINAAVHEELVHAAHQLGLRDQWRESGSEAGFTSYAQNQNRALLNETLHAAELAQRRGNQALSDNIHNALRQSVEAYSGGQTARTSSDLRSLINEADPATASRIANEVVRQIVQIRGADPITEHSWRNLLSRTLDWARGDLKGLRKIAKKAHSGEAGAMLGDATMRTEARLQQLQAMQRGEWVGPVGGSAHQEHIGAPQVKGPGQRPWAELKTKAGAYIKGGESAMLDNPETRPLALALRRKPSMVQRIGQQAKLFQLERAFNSIPGRDRARVVKEFSDYIRAEQMKQPLPAVSPDTARLIAASKDTLMELGKIAQSLNLHVRDSDGKVRPIRLIGRDYYPRMLSADVRDIFNNRDGSRAADFNALVNRQIARGTVKDRQEFIDKFTRAISGEPGSNDHFGNLERARQAQLPLEFYDFSPEALLRYADRATNRLAQIETYGQKIANKGKDLFDRAIEKVNASGNLSHAQKTAIIDRIAKERTAEYQHGDVSPGGELSSNLRNLASGAFLGNPQTSFMNLVSGAAQNFVFGGPGSFAKTAASFPWRYKELLTEARDRNILRANFKNILHDYDLATTPGWLSKSTRKFADIMLKGFGQNLTENINRVFAMQQAKTILADFAKDYGTKNTALSRSRNEFIRRRGINDLNALAAERGTGPLSDEFIRQYALDVHGSYGPSQAPAHILDSPMGRAVFQFQKWGANTSRMMTREFLMPMARAYRSGSVADKVYHTLRAVGYLAAGAGFTIPAQSLLAAIYHRDPKDPTLAEIAKAFGAGDNGRAVQMALQRAFGAYLLSGFSGLYGNYADVIQNLFGNDPQGRMKDPFHPPAWGVIEPLIAFAKGWAGEGGALPSPKLASDFAQSTLSAFRVGKSGILGLSNALGLHYPLAEQYAADQDKFFTKQRIRMFEAQNPVLQQKREQQGTRATAIQMSGRGPFDPTRDRILSGLISGHQVEVNDAIREWLNKVPPEQRAAEYKRIKDTIRDNTPLKVGGSSKPEMVMEFLNWARTNLPEGEARRIYSLAATYAKTAMDSGMEERSQAFNRMAKLDYDKFKPAPLPSASTQAAQKAKAEAEGRRVMADLIRRGNAANALLAR
jgi:hypothetical protein